MQNQSKFNTTDLAWQSHQSLPPQHHVSALTLDDTRDILTNDDELFKKIYDRPVDISLPSKEMIGAEDAETVDVLLNVLRDGHVVFDKDDPAMNRCFGDLHVLS